MERCPNCGASIRTGARFCTACGFRLIQPADSPGVTPTVGSTTAVAPIVVTETSSDAPSSESERVVWYGDPRSGSDADGDPDASEAGRSDAPSGVDDAPTTASDSRPSAQQSEPAIGEAYGTWPTEPVQDQTESETPDSSNAADADLAASVSADDVRLLPADVANDQDQVTSGGDDAVEPIASDDERLHLSQMSSEQTDSTAIADSRSDTEDPSGDFAPPESVEVTDASDDQLPPEIETSEPEKDPIDGESEPYDREAEESIDNRETGIDSTEEAPSPSNELNEPLWAAAAGTTGHMEPVTESSAWQDDVLIDTSFMAETDQPGSYDVNGDHPVVPDNVEPSTDPGRAEPDTSADVAPGIGDAGTPEVETASESTPTGIASNAPGGRDDDWEPWGAGGANDLETAGDRPGDANGLPIDQSDRYPGEQPQVAAATAHSPGIAQARSLLEQLRATIESLEPTAMQSVSDSGAEFALGSVAEIGQILDAIPSTTLESDRLAELTRLADDLTGRDYDIRALQRFAQERETILNLATEVQQQRDVIDQIRSVLAHSRR